MLERIRQRSQDRSGFTLVELLVVMLILGILAAIAVPSFFSQRDKAKDADAKADVRTMQTAMETHATETPSGSYAGVDVTRLKAIEETLNDANISIVAQDADSYTIRAASTTGNTFDIIRAANGAVTFDCLTEGEAGCPTGGNWGG